MGRRNCGSKSGGSESQGRHEEDKEAICEVETKTSEEGNHQGRRAGQKGNDQEKVTGRDTDLVVPLVALAIRCVFIMSRDAWLISAFSPKSWCCIVVRTYHRA